MAPEKSKLTAFTLKLSDDDRKKMKLICAVDASFKYQYQMFDAAIYWAIENRDKLIAMANSKDGDNRSYYVCNAVCEIQILEEHWNCTTTRALYTAVVAYLKNRGPCVKIQPLNLVKPDNLKDNAYMPTIDI